MKEKEAKLSLWIKHNKVEWEKDIKEKFDENPLKAIVLGHSYLEQFLRLALSVVSSSIEKNVKERIKKLDNFTFSELCDIAHFFTLLDDAGYTRFKQFNAERNTWVHNYFLNEKLDGKKIKELMFDIDRDIKNILDNKIPNFLFND